MRAFSGDGSVINIGTVTESESRADGSRKKSGAIDIDVAPPEDR
jgi:hypothetical protein